MTKGLFLLIAALFVLTISVGAQTLFGTITNEAGEALPHTHIYLPELRMGATSNAEGRYELRIAEGRLKIEFRNLGYQTFDTLLIIGESDVRLDLMLASQTYRLKEVKVLASGEDPALYIMRRAIAMAPYFRSQISEYSSQVYLKGSAKVNRIPRLLSRQLATQGIKPGEVFSIESISRISFSLPDQIKQEVIAQQTSGNNNNFSPMPLINSTLYNTAEYGMVSPFDPQALRVYRFTLLDMFEDQGMLVNRIGVKPVRKGNEFFEGVIHVFEGSWSIHSADLQLSSPMALVQMKQLYGPVEEMVWMPVSLSFDVAINALGIEVDYYYAASISDYKVTLNPASNHSFFQELRQERLRDEQVIQSLTKPSGGASRSRARRIETLMEKETMSHSDTRRLNRLMAAEISAGQSAQSLEVSVPYLTEDARQKRDSSFWAEIRPIPLTEAESKGFQRRDSLEKIRMSPAWQDSMLRARTRFKLSHAILGATYNYHSPGSPATNRLTNPGIVDGVSFNSVDGYTFDFPLKWVGRDTLGRVLSTELAVGYGLARGRLNTSFSFAFTYDGMRRGVLSLTGGSGAVDFNTQTPMGRRANELQTLLLEQNRKKFFQRDYINLTNTIEIRNGVNFQSGVMFGSRAPLQNYSEFRYFDWKERELTSNEPVNSTIGSEHLSENRIAEFALGIEWRPQQRYFIINGSKVYHSSRFPIFSLQYRKAISGIGGAMASFDYFEGGIRQELGLGVGRNLEYALSGGKFLNVDQMHFSDFRHFARNYSADRFINFKLLPHYAASTRDIFAEAHLAYRPNRIVLKHLNFLAGTMLSEQLYVNLLHTPHFRYYGELGYGVRNIFGIFTVDVVVGIAKDRFERIGFLVDILLPGNN